jgi:Flp pilus assembly protein TadD
VFVLVGVLAFAVLAGVLVAQTAGRRDAGEVATGDIRQSVTEKLNEAGRRGGEGDLAAAIELYDEVLRDDPRNIEALTYKGWMQTLDGDAEAGLEVLLEAATANPEYPDVHAFLAIVFFRNGLVEQADRELDRLDGLDPPPAIRDLTAQLRAEIDAALGSTTTAAG